MSTETAAATPKASKGDGKKRTRVGKRPLGVRIKELFDSIRMSELNELEAACRELRSSSPALADIIHKGTGTN